MADSPARAAAEALARNYSCDDDFADGAEAIIARHYAPLDERLRVVEEALRLATCEGKGYWTANGIRQDMPDKIAKLVRAALAQGEGKNG